MVLIFMDWLRLPSAPRFRGDGTWGGSETGLFISP